MGALRGQEYNSIVSAAPALLDYMADALGVAREKLTDMAKNGGISAQLMIEAFGKMRDSVAKDFVQLPLSVENATQSLTNSFSSLIEQINSDLKITDTLASSMQTFSQIIENNKEKSGLSKKMRKELKTRKPNLSSLDIMEQSQKRNHSNQEKNLIQRISFMKNSFLMAPLYFRKNLLFLNQ